jgi:hypothetical protein
MPANFDRIGGWWKCPWCQAKNQSKRLFGGVQRSTARSISDELAKRGLSGTDPNKRVVGGLTLIEGHSSGTLIAVGAICSLSTSSSGITVVSGTGMPVSHSYHDVVSVEASGRGLVHKGTRLMGGGFGLTGAVEGILAAKAINAATSRTQMDSVLKIATATSYYVFRSTTHTPVQIQQALAPLFDEVRRLHTPPTPGAAVMAETDDTLGQLKKLAELHDARVLNDVEFAAAKAKLVAKLT